MYEPMQNSETFEYATTVQHGYSEIRYSKNSDTVKWVLRLPYIFQYYGYVEIWI